MPKIPEDKKSDRKERVYRLIQRHPEGISERDIAEELNIECRTTNNYLTELGMGGKIYKEGQLWYSLPREPIVMRHFEPDPEIVHHRQYRRPSMAEGGQILIVDDYLTKPFSTDELMARIRTAQRHAQPQQEEIIFTSGRLKVDLLRRVVTVEGEPIKLSRTEYALLRLLIQHAGRVLTHQQILREVWGTEYIHETHYLRVYFAQLRQKIEENPALPAIIITEPGVGYRLVRR
ncbi:MAG: hypothetical protein BroJett018_35010 [Chloroflexota bacterium]|nr:MAG: hypothetical protein BroJett018_35010 [Chloroflexota bacterium]